MKVLLVLAPNFQRGKSASHLVSNIESAMPLGIAYLASVLEKAQHTVFIADGQFPHIDHDYIVNLMKKENIQAVGISSSTPNAHQSYNLITRLKTDLPSIPTIMGGPHVVAIGTKIFEECPKTDYLVFGEGENTIVELIDALGNKKDLHKVEGIAFKNNGKIIKTHDRPLITDLDSIPYPAFHLFDVHRYRPVGGMFRTLPFANIMTTRGCPYQCIFCIKSTWGNSCRFRSVPNVIGEIELLVKNYNIKEIAFFDDTFTADKQRAADLCNEIIKRFPKLIWKCSSRVNCVDLDLLKLMKKAGCYSIGYGIESGDNEILKKMRKGITVEMSRQAIKWTKQAGIETRAYYMINNLGDTKETVNKTIALSRELDTNFVDFELVHPFPGTAMWDLIQNTPDIKINKEKWNNWSTQTGNDIYFLQNDLTEEFIKKKYVEANAGFYLRPSKMIKNIKIAFANRHMFLASIKGTYNLLRLRAHS